MEASKKAVSLGSFGQQRPMGLVFRVIIISFWIMPFFPGKGMAQNMTARDYFLLGAAKYKCNACAQAIEDFTQAITLKKDYADALYGRSLAYLCVSDYRSALKDIDAAIRANPDEVLYYECKGRIKSQSGDHKAAINEFQSTLERDSSVWQAWYGLGVSAHAVKDTSTAFKAFSSSIRINPDYAMAWYGRGKLKQESGNRQAALGDYSKGLMLAPSYVPLLEARSQTYLAEGMYEAAAEDAQAALGENKSNPTAHFYLGEALRQQGKYVDADLSYAAAVKLQKKMAQALYMRGVCHDSLRDLNGAQKYYSAAISKNKGYKEAYISRAELWVKLLKPKKAVADLTNALKYSKDELYLNVRRGYLYLDLLDYQSAIQDFQLVIKRQPENAVALLGMGRAKYQIGNVTGACVDWDKAASLGNTEALDLLKKLCVE